MDRSGKKQRYNDSSDGSESEYSEAQSFVVLNNPRGYAGSTISSRSTTFLPSYEEVVRRDVTINPREQIRNDAGQGSNNSRSYASSETSSLPQSALDPNDEEENKMKVVIFHLPEQFGDEADREAADNTEVQQIFIAIGASSTIPINIVRHGKYQANTLPRRIVVTFDSESDKENVLSNADKLKKIPKWKKVSINAWLPPQQRRGYNPQVPSHNRQQNQPSPNAELLEKMARMEREMEALKQGQKHNDQNRNNTSKNCSTNQDKTTDLEQNQKYDTKLQPPFNQSRKSSSASSTRIDTDSCFGLPVIPKTQPFGSLLPNHKAPLETHDFTPDLQRNPRNRASPLLQGRRSPQPSSSGQNNNPNFGGHIQQPGNNFYQKGMPPPMYHQPPPQFHQPTGFPSAGFPLPNTHMIPHLQNVNTNFGGGQMPTLEQLQNMYGGKIPQEIMQMYFNSINQNHNNPSTFPQQPKRPFKKPKIPYKPKMEEKKAPNEPGFQNALYESLMEEYYGNKKILNILVLGETGVGKSTWINAIANYMTFDTLDEALEAPKPICLIPSQFTFYETTSKSSLIKLQPSHNEKDDNEVLSDKGESATQDPKTYQFETSKYIVNIIDTPGIGDVRGFEQDKENTKKILNAIGNYKELHAICFLFKSNDTPRLSLSFRYCISALLLQLHKDAVNNIVFSFTNARTSFYKRGDTHNALKHFFSGIKAEHNLDIPLNDDNTCCMDNEGFLLVCIHANGKMLPENEIRLYAKSWEISAASTHKFLEIAARNRPLRVADTISVNKARTNILHLAKPLADMNELIESNIKVFNDLKKELHNTANNLTDLQKKLKISFIGIEVIPLTYPKTVCTSPRCIETEFIPNTEQKRIIYRQICHDHCYLTNVNVEKVPEPNLTGCAAMHGQNCMRCECRWDTHMHIRFDQVKTNIEIEDKAMKDLIKQDQDASVVKQNLISNCENKINEYKAEQKEIIRISLRFGRFLNANAMLPYNDAFEKYVEQTINDEEKCIDAGGDRTKLENLKKMLAEYQQEKRMFDEIKKDIHNSGNNDDKRPITPDEIDVLKAQLFGLKHTGKTLENLFKATEEGITKNKALATIKYVPDVRKPKKQQNRGNNRNKRN